MLCFAGFYKCNKHIIVYYNRFHLPKLEQSCKRLSNGATKRNSLLSTGIDHTTWIRSAVREKTDSEDSLGRRIDKKCCLFAKFMVFLDLEFK